MSKRPIRIMGETGGKYFMKNKKGKKIFLNTINMSKNKIQKVFINIYEKGKKGKRGKKKIADGSVRSVPITQGEVSRRPQGEVSPNSTSGGSNTGKDMIYMTDVEKGNQLIKQISDNRKNYYLMQGIVDPPPLAEPKTRSLATDRLSLLENDLKQTKQAAFQYINNQENDAAAKKLNVRSGYLGRPKGSKNKPKPHPDEGGVAEQKGNPPPEVPPEPQPAGRPDMFQEPPSNIINYIRSKNQGDYSFQLLSDQVPKIQNSIEIEQQSFAQKQLLLARKPNTPAEKRLITELTRDIRENKISPTQQALLDWYEANKDLVGFGETNGDDALYESQLQEIIKKENLVYLPVIARDEIKDIEISKGGKPTFFVMNMSKRDDPDGGSHWVSVYMDKYNLDYFDSFGKPPPADIKQNLIKLSNRSEVSVLRKFKTNRKVLQTEEQTDCGYRASFFIDEMLSGKTFGEATNITENEIENFKNKYPNEYL